MARSFFQYSYEVEWNTDSGEWNVTEYLMDRDELKRVRIVGSFPNHDTAVKAAKDEHEISLMIKALSHKTPTYKRRYQQAHLV